MYAAEHYPEVLEQGALEFHKLTGKDITVVCQQVQQYSLEKQLVLSHSRKILIEIIKS